MNYPQPLILFDGVCNLCTHSVQFVIQRDAKQQFRFASIQSDLGQKVLQQYGLSTTKINTVVLLNNNQIYTHSTAALHIAQHLGGLWQLASLALWIPAPLRDIVYTFVAQNRYRWFGKQESCWLPTPELKNRFLT
ncbi:MAG: thiol-disulfide oxidoreductase DCC family protein [Chitinophagales bacterium]|nr:thiol-disulfide oxidoreductase DCC family protein [Sphingobacteriales bacterium]MBP7533269.1 thiol-disulfide oxidoreductase DCC family protein [Chitinophagales bacterium]